MKRFAGLLIVCTFTLQAAQFSQVTQTKVQDSLKGLIVLGGKVNEGGENPALSIFKGMQEKLSSPNMEGFFHECLPINQLPSAMIARKVHFRISFHPDYIRLSQAAKAAKKEDQEKAWKEFRMRGGHLIAEHIEGCSRVQFNRDVRKADEMFTKNLKLNPVSQEDTGFLEAGLIALIGLQQVQEEMIRDNARIAE